MRDKPSLNDAKTTKHLSQTVAKQQLFRQADKDNCKDNTYNTIKYCFLTESFIIHYNSSIVSKYMIV